MKQYKNLFLFLAITFLLPLILVFLQIHTENLTLKFVLYGIEAAAPSIVALSMIAYNRKLAFFFKENFKTQKLKEAIILPVIMSFATMFLAKIIACFLLRESFAVGSISNSQLIIILWAFIAEEFGWRGYLFPCLKKQMRQPLFAPLIVGVIWCFWHYHYFLFGGMDVPFVWFFIGCIVESYIYVYLLDWSNNCLLSSMVYHVTWNLFIHVFAMNPADNNGNVLPYIVVMVLEIIIFIVILSVKKDNRWKIIKK